MSSPDTYLNMEFSDSESDTVVQNSAPGSDDADFLAKAFGQLGTGNDFPFNTVEGLWADSISIENVVLQAEDYFFRVPPTLFLSKSSVFLNFYERGAFSGTPTCFMKYVYYGNDPNILEMLGPARPIIKMLGVTANEASYFLCALYDPEYFDSPPYKETLDLVLSVFKLASKYEVKYLRRRALAHLELAYPSSCVNDWAARDLRSTFPIDRQEFHQPVSFTLTATLNIIELCATYHTQWILPTAFYECCLYDMKTLLKHPKWNDGPGSMSQNIKTMIVCGYLAHKEESSRILTFLHTDLSNCNNGHVCLDIMRDELRKFCTVREQPREMQDFLGKVWDSGDWDEFSSQGMCEDCLSLCKSLHAQFRQLAWDNLPAMYGLPDWAILRAQRESVMHF